METVLEQRKQSTSKSPYNIVLDHFMERGRILMRGNEVQPYTFADGTLAEAMGALVNRIRVVDPRIRKNIEVMIEDNAAGFGVALSCPKLGHGVAFAAEPTLENGVLRYNGTMQFLSAHGKPQEIEMGRNSKAAYRAYGRKLAKIAEKYLLD
jgi:hypothetical protein